MDDVILIDKPQGWTSHDVVARLRTVLGVKKIGHAGTLDPLATGLLIVLVGREATKRQSEFLKLDKSYLVTARLGVETDSYDADGQVVAQAAWVDVEKITQNQVVAATKRFIGQSQQTVPAFSAVKVAGQKLYNQARKGSIDMATLPSRQITVTQFEVLDMQLDREQQQLTVTLEVSCGSGTYVRSLVHDLGQELGVGAMVTQLRRTRIGDFLVSKAQEITTVASIDVPSV